MRKFNFDIDGTDFCCAIATILNEDWTRDCTVQQAVKELRQFIQGQTEESVQSFKDIGEYDHYGTYLASTCNNPRGDFLAAVYKAAGFRKFGRSKVNYRSGNIVTKWYIDVGLKFKA